MGISGEFITGWIGWGGALFFIVILWMIVRELLDTKPRLIIDDKGIFDRKHGFILWSEIKDAFLGYQSVYNGHHTYLCLKLEGDEQDYEQWYQSLPWYERINLKIGWTGELSKIRINITGLDEKPKTILYTVLYKIGSQVKVKQNQTNSE